ncbi:MAG: glutamate--tRNA ligase [Candidatus Marinimicrobia bacterium]|nr:glutamate--tRNA ligase [Candidatus Neomarinimicrobiota bacterium]
MTDMISPKVRFAPSPTGELHLGGARTALFNYLFAKHHNGQFFLRVEDTDRERSKDEFTDQICESLKWLGLQWDGEILFQSNRINEYQSAIQTLLAGGNAYRCFCSKDVLEKSRAEGMYQYPKTCRYLDADEISKHLNSGESNVIRILIPEGQTSYHDIIYGPVNVNNNEIDDFIIARSDGSPTYNMAVVVDDHAMDITHVIRGEDHISNTSKQIQIYKALGFDTPVFAHLPMILGPDKKRLSKRHGAPGIQQFKDDGYLPDALLNYLVMLGWNPDSEQEIFVLDEMIAKFDLAQVHKKGAVYDEKKLYWISGQHMHRLGNKYILEGILAVKPSWGNGFDLQYKYSVIELLKVRAKSILEFMNQSDYFFNDPEKYEPKSVEKNWSDNSVNNFINTFKNKIDAIENLDVEIIEKELRNVAETYEISAGKIIHPVRLALSGIPNGPSLFSMMELLGKETCIRRLNKALNMFPKS